ncbi:MAG TPA: hypothetical protein VMR62_31295 [Bryobacteraceae bacterium]|nr:hypothetical protein [Bryobacteraceae bacterium]
MRESPDQYPRHLEDQPILAQPPSAAYQIGKFTPRHKALVAGVIASTLEAARARRAETLALAAQQAATRDRDRAVKAENQAEQDHNSGRDRRTGSRAALRDRNLALVTEETGGHGGGDGCRRPCRTICSPKPARSRKPDQPPSRIRT